MNQNQEPARADTPADDKAKLAPGAQAPNPSPPQAQQPLPQPEQPAEAPKS